MDGKSLKADIEGPTQQDSCCGQAKGREAHVGVEGRAQTLWVRTRVSRLSRLPAETALEGRLGRGGPVQAQGRGRPEGRE